MNVFIIAAAILAKGEPVMAAVLSAYALVLGTWGVFGAWVVRRLEHPVLSAALLGALPVLAFCPFSVRAIAWAVPLSLPGVLTAVAAARWRPAC